MTRKAKAAVALVALLLAVPLGAAQSSSFWELDGNAGTNPPVHFLGTTDGKPLVIKVNNQQAAKFEPTAGTPNVLEGHVANQATSGVQGAAIGGGGSSAGSRNTVTDEWGTVSGGIGNRAGNGDGTPTNTPHATVGGGFFNTASGRASAVGGGRGNAASGLAAVIAGGQGNEASASWAALLGGKGNTAEGTFATLAGGNRNLAHGSRSAIGGGSDNVAWGNFATVPGGRLNNASGLDSAVGGGIGNAAGGTAATVAGGAENVASGDRAVVGGGFNNEASGVQATVPGGNDNLAAGLASFAAGTRAKALHDRAFVWSSSSGSDFQSTAPDQFLVSAAGGVGIGTNAPQQQLHVSGSSFVTDRMFVGNQQAAVFRSLNGMGPQTSGWQPDPFLPGIWMEDATAESGGFFANGNMAVIFSPGDPDLLRVFDEDLVPAGQPRFVIDGIGRLGVRVPDPANIIHVEQGSSTDPIADAWLTYSSARWKANVTPLDDGLDRVLRLQGVAYDVRGTDERTFGLVAEDVAEVAPEVVAISGNGSVQGIDYARLVTLLIEAVKAQQEEIDTLEGRLADLEARVGALEDAE